MRVLVDTCVWSIALRHGEISGGQEVSELMELIKELRVQLIGPVRQEILSGIRNHSQFTKLRDYLRPFPDLELTTSDFESAAEFHNRIGQLELLKLLFEILPKSESNTGCPALGEV